MGEIVNIKDKEASKMRRRFKPKPTIEDRNIDLRELCSIWGRSRSSTLRDIDSGKLPKPFRIGGKNYWRLSEIKEVQEALRA